MLLDDIATLLTSAGVGTVGTTLFKSTMPDTPDTATAVIEYGGMPPVHHMATGPGAARVVIEQPAVQVLCRALDYPTARNLAETAFKALDGYSGTVNTVRYWTYASQSPYLIQRDANDRVWLGFSVYVKKPLSP